MPKPSRTASESRSIDSSRVIALEDMDKSNLAQSDANIMEAGRARERADRTDSKLLRSNTNSNKSNCDRPKTENVDMSRMSCCTDGGKPSCKKSKTNIGESDLRVPKTDAFLLNHEKLCSGKRLSKFRESRADEFKPKHVIPKAGKMGPKQAALRINSEESILA